MSDLLDRLPYELSRGVTAIREGLCIDCLHRPWLSWILNHEYIRVPKEELCKDALLWPWPHAAESLRYRDGEPIVWTANDMLVTINYSEWSINHAHGIALDRVSAMLHKDADGFRILYACIEELGDET